MTIAFIGKPLAGTLRDVLQAKSADEAKFEEYRESLHGEAQRLTCYVQVYRRLHERRADRLDEMNVAPAFFGTVTDALFSAIVLWVDKLFSEDSQRGLHNFLTFVEHHRELVSIEAFKRRRNLPDAHWLLQQLKADQIDYQGIQNDRLKLKDFPPLRSFRLRRDKFYAHFDKAYFFDRGRIDADAPLKLSDLETVLELLTATLNRYSGSYDGQVFHLAPLNVNDVDALLDELHCARARGGR